MISLILPFWCRQEATDASLCLMAEHYMDLDLEIIVVDDGSPEPYDKPTLLPLDIHVIRLPFKTMPRNPCTPYNFGVSRARGEYIALSNPETLHRTPILEAMRDEIKDSDTYVTASAWCADANKWHAHSSIVKKPEVSKYVPDAQYHFMSMMKRELWDKIGGFDEDYRLGAGYDDPDLVRRLHRAGAKFVHRDDLVVEHVRKGAHAEWEPKAFERNLGVFLSKWKPL